MKDWRTHNDPRPKEKPAWDPEFRPGREVDTETQGVQIPWDEWCEQDLTLIVLGGWKSR